jgi:class 3 adenylate cyclase/tetratricopeptide (TPR) repeat protein
MNELNQRHQLVLLFTDLTDSTRIAAQLEPEHYAELLSHLRVHITTIIARHGGEVVRVDGDGALCIFGFPLAHEDAGRRATEAALDLHTAVAELAGETRVSLHSGIHAGVVLLRSGDLVRGRYEMLGDATNIAARLCDAAGPGGILVSEETLGADRHLFRTGPQRRIALSGHNEPLCALPIVAREDVPHRFAAREIRGLSPFVGRQAERKQLLDWLAADSTLAPVMLIHGSPGIGKSRLLKVVARDASDFGWTVARGFCEGYLGAPPLQPILQIATALNPQVIADLDPVARIESIIRSGSSFPLLLVVDDWQWADDASRDFVARLVNDRLPKLRILLLSRENDSGLDLSSSADAIELGPLDRDAARTTIEGLLAIKDPFAVARIEAATGGSPLLIEELCHAYARNSSSVADSKLRGAWFDLSVQSRFALLAPDDAQLLRLAAVIGNVAAPWLLAAVQGAAIEATMLDRLEAADFLYRGEPGDTLRFKHGLTRDAVYAGIGLAERRTLHSEILAALDDYAAIAGAATLRDAMAYHAVAAGNQERGLQLSVAAGNAALQAGALDRAQAHFVAAFGLIERDEQIREHARQLRAIIGGFGRACVVDPSRDHIPVFARMHRSAEKCADLEALTLATYWTGAQLYGLGEPRRSLETLQSALSAAEELGSAPLIAQMHANLGQSNAIACRYREAIQHMDLAIADKLARRNPDRPSTSLAYCISSRGFVRADMGDFAVAFQDFDLSVSVMAGHKDPIFGSLDTQRSLALIYCGEFEQAAEFADASEDLALRSRSRFLVYSARVLREFALWKATGHRVHFDSFAEAVLTLQLADRPQRLSYKLGWIAEAMADRGEEKTTRLFASLAFKRALKGDRLGEASAARALAKLAARSGGRRDFRRYLTHAGRAAQIRLSPREAALNRICEAQCLALTGDREPAERAYDLAKEACAELGMERWLVALD